MNMNNLKLKPIVVDELNNECGKYIDNLSKLKLVNHSIYPICYLHHHILALEYFKHLIYYKIVQSISHI